MRKSPYIGGSILPSNSPEILLPMECGYGTLQVRPMAKEDTHYLVLITKTGEKILATHPNGYSCHALAKRIIAGDEKRIQEQAEYIVRCGGTLPCAAEYLNLK